MDHSKWLASSSDRLALILVLTAHVGAAANEGVPGQGYAQVVPVDPGQPGGQVGGVPLETAGGAQLASQALLDIVHRL